MSATTGTRKTEQGAIVGASPGAGATTAATRPGEYLMHSAPENGEPVSTRAGMHTGVHSGPRVVEGGPGATGGAGSTAGAHAGQSATVPYPYYSLRDDEYSAGPKQV